MRSLFALLVVSALGIGWITNLQRHKTLKNQLAEIQRLNVQLTQAQNRLASSEIEMQHFSKLANANIEQLDVLLDSQRRRAMAKQQVAETQCRIDALLGFPDESVQKQLRLKIAETEIDQCRTWLASLKKNPEASTQEISQAVRQLAYFESQAVEIKKQ